MAKIVVARDKVDGADKHQVNITVSGNPAVGVGDYDYKGEVSTGLSDFVSVDGTFVGLVSSGSKLRSDGVSAHAAPGATSVTPTPDGAPVSFVVPAGVGDGVPSSGTGSPLFTVGGVKVLLDGDKFDTCGIATGIGKASVAASGQDWVTAA